MLLLFATAAVADEPAGWDMTRLMQDLAQVKIAKGRFVERKYLGILTAPLESSGTLIYIAPSRLEKHTLTPHDESLVLEGDRLTIESQQTKRRRTLLLQDYPVIWMFVESIRSTLAGDRALLQRFYEITLEGEERKWRLVLKPIDPKMQELISEIRIGGSHSRIDSIEFFESGGDRSVMTITRDVP
ncbi:MAG TPA: outer membrane lipoprotein carrier protein LolA [Burkholderiales bacterium]|nr:outer membrane lipoprotein carrier protein LolA [Burkholderiales bacterium]